MANELHNIFCEFILLSPVSPEEGCGFKPTLLEILQPIEVVRAEYYFSSLDAVKCGEELAFSFHDTVLGWF
jgi:hypothetical protein